ncbi:NUDIX hydrolase [Nocardia cyriacigeorgica]|uniref:Mutator mutT protein n=1 Tax=Nocardia cyriacigeorgica TaxID=135487 RepID=A0A4U8VS24_9NOCA|nr:NUDIX domain-containing protein [Nocardia cyriacigeorgica]VFA96360.1 mutator mutT protein [Nocardia cyriacigeorgica]
MVSSSQHARQTVRDLVEQISVFDEIEGAARSFALDWIDSGAGLFRVHPPDEPNPHLCVYAVLVDDVRRRLLVTDHVKANAWLCPGGHVDDGEDPRAAVLREAREELGIEPAFHPRFAAGDPFFLTVTATRGDHSHTDVTFWFLLSGSEEMELVRDPAEARELRWFAIDDPTEWSDPDRFDPGMLRFLRKLTSHLDAPASVG